MWVYVTLTAEINVDDDILQNEYDNDIITWAADNVTVDAYDGMRSMGYSVDWVEEMEM